MAKMMSAHAMAAACGGEFNSVSGRAWYRAGMMTPRPSLTILLTLGALALPLPAAEAGQAEATTQPASRPTTQAGVLANGKATGISEHHGNVYTDIKADRYEELGLEPGDKIKLVWEENEVALTVGERYNSVPTGEAVAVLHREGLTFAIRDGNFTETHGLTKGTAFRLLSAAE